MPTVAPRAVRGRRTYPRWLRPGRRLAAVRGPARYGSPTRRLPAARYLQPRPCRLQKREGVYCVRGIKGQLQSNHRTGGVADDMRPLDPQVTHQRATMCSLLLEI